jgi:L-ascorbate metabolism protein UlaG (beta-lactamase superfamily)
MATSRSSLEDIGTPGVGDSGTKRQAPGNRISIGRSVSVELLYRDFDAAVPPRVDCSLLFLGTHLDQILGAFRDAVSLFSEFHNPAQLLERLQASANIAGVYESRIEDGKVCLEMRDSIFREPGPLDTLEFRLRILVGKRRLFYPVPLERFLALGNLFPLLVGRHNESEIQARLSARLTTDDADWAFALLRFLKSEGCLQPFGLADERPLTSKARPRVTLLSHSSLLLQSERGAVLVDPVVWQVLGGTAAAFEVLRERIGAVCCSHSHWDHCHLQTLLWIDKEVPVFIPKEEQLSALNPPMAAALRRFGFTNVREVEPWASYRVDDIEIVPTPFYGEQDEPDSNRDHYTYILKTPGLCLYGGVDCYRDSFGDMRPVLERVGQVYHPDVAFLPVTKWICYYKFGGVNAFCRYLDQDLFEQSFQYVAGPEDAADWSLLLGAPVITPYATFTFSSWKATPETVQFHRALARRGIGERFFPMKPLDTLAAGDLGNGLRLRARRWVLMAWSHGVGAIYRFGKRASLGRAFRYLRRAAHI